jgi:hypothetical protein
MDFGAAEAKLRKDHERLRSRNRNRTASRTLASNDATSKAKKAEDYRKKQLEKKNLSDLKEKKMQSYVKNGFDQVERKLGVIRQLGPSDSLVSLEAASVHGLGDKITLPTSILATLAERDLLKASQDLGQPLFFRLGIRRTDVAYNFPQSESMRALMEEYGKEMNDPMVSAINIDDDEDDQQDDGDYMPDDDIDRKEVWIKAYLDELACQYSSYTYATVVEFSQDEGYIGLPFSVANTLLQPDGAISIDNRLTVDPAQASTTDDLGAMDIDDKDEGNGQVAEVNLGTNDENVEDKTPGHAAYGMFPVPVHLIEVTLLTNLPLGSKCTLQPTINAIKQGFYNLKNVKLALEQSLIRTRGSLNVGDLMYCWFRGKRFDLNVQEVIPSHVGAISCVNCDIEVDIAPPKSEESEDSSEEKSKDLSRSVSGGYTLSADSPIEVPITSSFLKDRVIELLPEPEDDQTENVVAIQIRGAGKVARRRFDTQCTIKNLFDFAISEDLIGESAESFRLVTRFPRRVFQLGSSEEETLLADLGLTKQEMLMVEKL